MSLKFTKIHATGNDFLLFKEQLAHPSEVAKKLCHRRFGFGADGILFPTSSEIADITMHYYNADGSIASMCGNGYRAFIRFALDEGLLTGTHFTIETLAGVIESRLCADGDIKLIFNTVIDDVKPPHVVKATTLTQPFSLLGYDVHVCYVGTLHALVFVDECESIHDELAHNLCTHPSFPHHINVNFIQIIDSNTIKVKTYERGVGWTYSCGTGSVASGYGAHVLKQCETSLRVVVQGGELEVSKSSLGWSLKGPAVVIGQGESV